MPRCAIQIVMGPAGSGKSTYCQVMQEHAAVSGRRTIHVGNLDPAAEIFQYQPTFDIRELISVTEVMEELGLGPNGALIYCMEYLLENLDWLHDNLEQLGDDEYLLLDCPGQVELYTHVPVMRRILDSMRQWGYDGSMVSVFCLDATFLIDATRFLSGCLLSLSAMVALELPHVSVLTKCDLMEPDQVDRILNYESASQIWNLQQDQRSILQDTAQQSPTQRQEQERLQQLDRRRLQRERLTDSISQLLDDWQMVSFVPLNVQSEDSVDHVLSVINHTIQYEEDLEVQDRDNEMPDINGTLASE